MRILFLGDIFARSGREAVISALPGLRHDLNTDIIIANGENAAHGFGITDKICAELFASGIDIITGGNHSFDKQEIIPYIEETPCLIRPLNLHGDYPGKGYVIHETDRYRVLVINVLGNIFMNYHYDNAFTALERIIPKSSPMESGFDAVIVDFHGETTSEKNCAAYYFDGRVTMLIGTHTHIPTADHRILPHGTAYQTDVGMCGDYYSSIGIMYESAISRILGTLPMTKIQPAEGQATICGIFVETDNKTGLAQSIHPIRIGPNISNSMKYL